MASHDIHFNHDLTGGAFLFKSKSQIENEERIKKSKMYNIENEKVKKMNDKIISKETFDDIAKFDKSLYSESSSESDKSLALAKKAIDFVKFLYTTPTKKHIHKYIIDNVISTIQYSADIYLQKAKYNLNQRVLDSPPITKEETYESTKALNFETPANNIDYYNTLYNVNKIRNDAIQKIRILISKHKYIFDKSQFRFNNQNYRKEQTENEIDKLGLEGDTIADNVIKLSNRAEAARRLAIAKSVFDTDQSVINKQNLEKAITYASNNLVFYDMVHTYPYTPSISPSASASSVKIISTVSNSKGDNDDIILSLPIQVEENAPKSYFKHERPKLIEAFKDKSKWDNYITAKKQLIEMNKNNTTKPILRERYVLNKLLLVIDQYKLVFELKETTKNAKIIVNALNTKNKIWSKILDEIAKVEDLIKLQLYKIQELILSISIVYNLLQQIPITSDTIINPRITIFETLLVDITTEKNTIVIPECNILINLWNKEFNTTSPNVKFYTFEEIITWVIEATKNIGLTEESLSRLIHGSNQNKNAIIAGLNVPKEKVNTGLKVGNKIPKVNTDKTTNQAKMNEATQSLKRIALFRLILMLKALQDLPDDDIEPLKNNLDTDSKPLLTNILIHIKDKNSYLWKQIQDIEKYKEKSRNINEQDEITIVNDTKSKVYSNQFAIPSYETYFKSIKNTTNGTPLKVIDNITLNYYLITRIIKIISQIEQAKYIDPTYDLIVIMYIKSVSDKLLLDETNTDIQQTPAYKLAIVPTLAIVPPEPNEESKENESTKERIPKLVPEIASEIVKTISTPWNEVTKKLAVECMTTMKTMAVSTEDKRSSFQNLANELNVLLMTM
jgi:hypothetical protein